MAAVSSLVVSEISGSRALCTGRVRVMPTEATAARTQTSPNDASAITAAPSTAAVTACTPYPRRRACGARIRPSRAAAADASSAAGTTCDIAITLAPRTPWPS